ncbi:MAG: ABC transporter permease [Spirochaetes bacterium]|nr:ABC transporter permease [Spirochaetota bacterium]
MNLRLILEFTKRDFTEKYAGSLLGVVWAFIYPLVMITIYAVVFSNIMGAKLSPGQGSGFSYVSYLVAGIIPWTAFANTIMRSSTVFLEKKGVISKVHLSLPLLPLYIVLSETITFIITFLLYLILLIVMGMPLYKSIIFIPFIYVVHQIFAYALGLFFAMMVVFIRDFKELINVAFQIWFWLTPIVYVMDIVPTIMRVAMDFNPAYLFISAYHDIFVYGKYPDFISLLILAVSGHVILLFSYVLFKKIEKDIRDFI